MGSDQLQAVSSSGEPTDAEIDDMAARVRNWSRWGDDDQCGTTNLVTDESRRQAAALVQRGIAVSLAREMDLGRGSHIESAAHVTWKSGGVVDTAGDFIGFAYHGAAVTHLDALNHVHRGAVMYNNNNAHGFTPATGGYQRLAVTNIASKLCGRAVLVDLARHGGEPAQSGDRVQYGTEHIKACLDRQGTTVRSGDMLVARFGHSNTEFNRPIAGLAAEVVLWLHEQDISAMLTDGPADAIPPRAGRWPIPIHQITICEMGLPLIDNCDLESISRVTVDERRYVFLLTASALPIRGGTGSPVNPIAIF
jgi:kynurenine formamidase